MADGGNVVQCGTFEDLATLRSSMRKHLLDLEDKEVGQLTIHFDGHQYNATRDKQGSVKVCRVDLEQDFGKRLPTVMAEFFTHRVADFFCLRGVGSRASRMASIIDNWVRLPDGQETVGTPPWFMSATVTIQAGPDKTVISQDLNYVQNHLANHCPKFLSGVTLTKSVKKLDERDLAWHRTLAQCFFQEEPGDRSLDTALPFDMAACHDAIRKALTPATGDTHLDEEAFAALVIEMEKVAQSMRSDAATAPLPDTVVQARFLLLGRALVADGRDPAQALDVLNALRAPAALHDLADDSPIPRQCWQAARLLAGTDFGFQMLCELVDPPADIAPEAADQWRTGLKLYLEASNHLLAEAKSCAKAQLKKLDAERHELQQRAATLSKRLQTFKATANGQPDKGPQHASTKTKVDTAWTALQQDAQDLKTQQAALRLRAANFKEELAHTIQSWSACPLTAHHHAQALAGADDDGNTNLLPHRTLQAAVKLMQQRSVLDPDRLESESIEARNGANIDVSGVLTPQDAFALAVWRNGFRDDRKGTPLAEYAGRLNTMLIDMLPHDRLDEAGNVVETVWKGDSPFRVAFESDLAAAVTRRTISQQAADFHAATGSLGRLLVLKMKVEQGLPLAHYEEILWDALKLRDSLRQKNPCADAPIALKKVEHQIDKIVEDVVAASDTLTRLTKGKSSAGWVDNDQIKAMSTLRDSEAALCILRASLSPPDAASPCVPLTVSNLGITRLTLSPNAVCDAVRAELLRAWLASTEKHTRWKAWTITPNVRNAVIANLSDIIDVQQHSQAIAKELDTYPQIDHQILQQWAYESGILVPTDETTGISSEMNRLARRNTFVSLALELGQDKVDAERLAKVAGNIERLRPQTRQEYSELMTHMLDLNLGCGILGEVARNFGAQVGLSIDTGCDLPGTGGLDVSASCTASDAKIVRGGITSSSIGSVVVQASEERRSLQSVEIGLGVKASGVSQAIDTSFSSMASYEVGHGVRIAPTPGMRNWADIGRPFVKAMLGDKVTTLAEQDLANLGQVDRPTFGALTELCWRGFQPLLDGSLAFNLFASTRSTETVAVGASTGVSASGPGGFAKLSASVRVATEHDMVTRQSRVDCTGSRRVAVHSIGTGSRMTVGLRFMLNLLPHSLQERIHHSFSAGPLGGISATFRERGSTHTVRRETLHGTTQGNLAWDIVFHTADDLVAHMNQEEVRRHWAEYKKLRGDDPNADLDNALRSVIAHASHANQTFMVRRQLKPEKVAEFNALAAMLDGLNGTNVGFLHIIDEHAIKARCLALLTDVDSYQFSGFGLYANDRREQHIGLAGEIIKTSGETVAVNTEQEWKTARITPELLRSAGQTGSPIQLPQMGDAEGGRAAAIAPVQAATAISSLV